jgi:hypothetical protein
MAVRQKADGSFIVANAKQMREALDLSREKSRIVAEIEAEVEAEYGLSEMRNESLALHKAVCNYLMEKDENYEDDISLFTIVKPKRWRWNADKLRTILPKNIFISICRYEPDETKIDEAVKAGKLKAETIESAYEATPSKPYVKHSIKSNGREKGREEAERVAATLGD